MGVFPPNVYLVVGQQAALIDAGLEDGDLVQARLDHLKEISSPQPSYIVLTHGHHDHLGGVGRFKSATGARLVCHQLIALGEVKVKDGDRVDLGGLTLEVIHTPGHSPGHICLYLRERQILFSGDHVLGLGTTVIVPEQGDMALYMTSLEKLLAMNIALICPGHGPLIKEPRRKLWELLEHRRERESQVLQYIGQGKATVEEIVKEIYPELDTRLHHWARDQVLAHIIKLEKEGRVGRHDREFHLSARGQ